MTNRFWLWWIPGMLALPLIAVGPSTGWPVMIFFLIMMFLLRTWVNRTLNRVGYINAQIDRGVVFSKKATFLDQTVSRRKRLVLNYENVKRYSSLTQKLCFTMMLLVVFVIVYSNINWMKHPNISMGIDVGLFITVDMARTGALITSVVGTPLLMLTCFLAFLSCRSSAQQLKAENEPIEQTARQAEEKKKAAIEEARDTAKKSGGMIANLAKKTASEDAEELAYKKAGQADKSGSIASKARLDVSDEGTRMTLDEKIEAEHLAREAEKKAKAEAESAEAEAE